jgi:hypothetical protein
VATAQVGEQRAKAIAVSLTSLNLERKPLTTRSRGRTLVRARRFFPSASAKAASVYVGCRH